MTELSEKDDFLNESGKEEDEVEEHFATEQIVPDNASCCHE